MGIVEHPWTSNNLSTSIRILFVYELQLLRGRFFLNLWIRKSTLCKSGAMKLEFGFEKVVDTDYKNWKRLDLYFKQLKLLITKKKNKERSRWATFSFFSGG